MADYTVVEGDITLQDTDCIVNAWNRNFFPWWLLVPQGVSRAIRKKAGNQPFRELARMPVLKLGDAVHTSAGNLSYKAIIHVAGINAFWHGTQYSIRTSVVNALTLAESLGIQSMAIPLIGAGSGSYNQSKSLKIIKQTLDETESPVRVIVVVYSGKRR